MKKILTILLSIIIFFQTQVFSFPIQPISILLSVNNSVINNPIFGYQNSQSSNFVSLSHCEPEVKQSSRCCYRFQSSAFVGAVDYGITERKHEKKGGLFDMIDISNMRMDISGGGISLSTSYKESKDKENITSQKAVSNVIQSGNNIILETSGALISQASQIVSDGNIDITTGNNLILTFAEEIVSRTKEHSETTVTVGVKIGNAYVDVGLAAKNLVDSTQNLNKAKDEYNEMQKKYERGEISKTALEDAKVNLEIATLNVANATIALATSISGAATSASSSLGTGLYGSAFSNYDTTTTTSKEKTVTQNFGLISSNKDIKIKSGTNLVQEATNITAQETLTYDVAKELSILAGKTTNEQESKTEHRSAGISYGNNAIQVSGGYGQDSSKAKTTSYSNSQSIAKDIIIKAQNANISGANIQATNNLEVDIKNNLLLESKQDNYYLKGNGYNIGGSIGIGLKGGSNSGGASYGNNKSNNDVMWVNNQTSLTGGNNVNILVGNKTEVKGAVIANAEVGYDSDGKIAFRNDKGNLTINTKELEYSDIKDKNVSESNGFNIGLNIGAGTDKQTATKYPKGSLSIGATANGHEKEQITKATIGNGKIMVDGKEQTEDNLSGLNRDTNNTQTITKDETTRALNIDTTIDLRLLSEEGRKDIWNDIKNVDKNSAKALTGAVGTVISTGKTIYDVTTKEEIGITDAIDEWKANQKELVNQNNYDRKTLNELSKGKTVEEITEATNGKAKLYYDETDEAKGFRQKQDTEEQNSYINTAQTDITNTKEFINTLAHENSHIYTENETVSNSVGSYANTMWTIGNIFNFTSIDTSGNITPSQWYSNNYTSNILQTNTQIAGMIPKQDRNERVIEYSRDLDGVPVGKHSFLLLEPDNMDDFTEEKMKQMGLDTNKFKFIDIGNSRKGIIVGGYAEGGILGGLLFGKLKSKINFATDVKTVQEYKNNETKTYLNPEARIVKSQKDDTTFIYNILNNTSNYILNTNITPIKYFLLGDFSGRNCNGFTNNLLNYSGADMNRNKDMNGFDLGRDAKIDSSYFQLGKKLKPPSSLSDIIIESQQNTFLFLSGSSLIKNTIYTYKYWRNKIE